MSNELQTITPQATAMTSLSVHDILGQVKVIQDVMSAAMHEGEHYGVIPGCGKKPSLLKPGAEKLCMMFRLAPHYMDMGGKIEVEQLSNNHRNYNAVCSLVHINTNAVWSHGVGSCSTMESKYRFRTGATASTGKPVPKEYWNERKSNPAKAQDLIGGKGFTTKKGDDGQWEIWEQGDKVENDNPADQYNTCLKMAKKRAFVDACLSALSCSDIFTQDIEDIEKQETKRKPVDTEHVVVEPVAQPPAVHAPTAPAPQQTEIPLPPDPAWVNEPAGSGDDGNGHIISTIADVQVKEGAKNGKPWKLTTVTLSDGKKCGTFDAKIADICSKNVGSMCDIIYDVTAKGNKNIVTINIKGDTYGG